MGDQCAVSEVPITHPPTLCLVTVSFFSLWVPSDAHTCCDLCGFVNKYKLCTTSLALGGGNHQFEVV